VRTIRATWRDEEKRKKIRELAARRYDMDSRLLIVFTANLHVFDSAFV
jgi:hypothetical protein